MHVSSRDAVLIFCGMNIAAYSVVHWLRYRSDKGIWQRNFRNDPAAYYATSLFKLDRRRIREHLERNGKKLLDIAWKNSRLDNRARTYDVTFRSRDGHVLICRCITKMFQGVQWITAPSSPPDAVHRQATQ